MVPLSPQTGHLTQKIQQSTHLRPIADLPVESTHGMAILNTSRHPHGDEPGPSNRAVPTMIRPEAIAAISKLGQRYRLILRWLRNDIGISWLAAGDCLFWMPCCYVAMQHEGGSQGPVGYQFGATSLINLINWACSAILTDGASRLGSTWLSVISSETFAETEAESATLNPS